MKPSLPWLCQGDVFADAPWVLVDGTASKVVADVSHGAALLITENSQLDKRRSDGRSSLPGLQLLPLRELSDRPPDIQSRLRSLTIDPPSLVYVGRPPTYSSLASDTLGAPEEPEMYGYFGEAYFVPAAYFGLEIRAFDGNLFADADDPSHVVPSINDGRVGQLTAEQMQVLRAKMWAYWTKVRLK